MVNIRWHLITKEEKKTMVQNERKEEEEDGLFLDLAMEKYVMQYRSLFLCPTDKRERERKAVVPLAGQDTEKNRRYTRKTVFFFSSLLRHYWSIGITMGLLGTM